MEILGLENNYALHARKVQSVRILNMRTITNIKYVRKHVIFFRRKICVLLQILNLLRVGDCVSARLP